MHTPSYLMRIRAASRLLTDQVPGRLLEIGCGRGDFLRRLGPKGWHGIGFEPSAEAAAVAARAVSAYSDRFKIVSTDAEILGRFPTVLALEVLEHIEDDRAVLARWHSWVEPGGALILSVPAHPAYWSLSDEVGGHVRRYTRDSLRDLLTETGFAIECFWSIGFPVTSVTRRLRNFVSKRAMRQLRNTPRASRALLSSFDSQRASPLDLAARFIEPPLAWLLHGLQLPFLESDLGAGYLLRCRRPLADDPPPQTPVP